MRTCRLGLLGVATLGVALSLGTITAASAGPSVTWNPSATGNTTAGTFTTDHFFISNWATINVPGNPVPAGSINESGFLESIGFTLGGSSVSTVHTVGSGGYGIYEQYTTTSHLSTSVSCGTGCTNLLGAFDTVTAKVFLYSTVHGLASFSFSASHVPTIHLPTGANQVLLATESGPVGGSPNIAEITLEKNSHGVITSQLPSATVDTLWTDVFSPGFFISPPFGVPFDLEQAFTNTPSVITTSGPGCSSTGTNCIYEIHGGGGNATFLVPEPASLALLGFGLVTLGLARRRRA